MSFQAFYRDEWRLGRVGGGIITRVDDISVLVGNIDQDTGVDNAAYIGTSDIIGNDRNTGEGDLRLVSIEPNINWKTIDGAKVARQIESELGTTTHSYGVTFNHSGAGFSLVDTSEADPVTESPRA